ncbi:hypothetical protein BC567DRAFT_39237 [Phyllosticta citribraziliensis]
MATATYPPTHLIRTRSALPINKVTKDQRSQQERKTERKKTPVEALNPKNARPPVQSVCPLHSDLSSQTTTNAIPNPSILRISTTPPSTPQPVREETARLDPIMPRVSLRRVV